MHSNPSQKTKLAVPIKHLQETGIHSVKAAGDQQLKPWAKSLTPAESCVYMVMQRELKNPVMH